MIKIKKYQIEDYISDATQDALDLKADLVDGKVPASQLPSFVDDVIEVANYAALPIPGASGVIYITLDTNKVYRWTGSVYVEIASGVTNLSYTPGVSNGTVNSDTGSDATIPLADATNAGLFSAAEKSKLEGIAPNANVGVIPNTPITGATKTKITYDTKGLVTAGEDATAADIADSTNKRYVTDANLTVINNTSGTNTGDNATNSQYSGLAASKQDNITLTTTGTSGASTLVGSTLNIPQYSGATNLSYTASPTNGIVNSSTGTGATITLADATNAGLLNPAKFTVLENTSGTNTGDQNLQSVTDIGATTTNTININPFDDEASALIANKNGVPTGVVQIYSNGYNEDSKALYINAGNSSAIYAISNYNEIIGDNYNNTILCQNLSAKSTASGLYIQSPDATAIRSYSSTGIGEEINLGSSAKGIIINSGTSSTGVPFAINKNGVDKLTINQQGELTAQKLIKDGGTSSQILAADGSVITAGTNITITGGTISSVGGAGGGGSSVNYYLNGGTSQGTFGGTTYYEFSKTAVIGTGADFSRGTNGFIASFITDVADPSLLLIPAGNWNLEFFFNSSSAGGSPSFYVELYKYDGTTFTSIASSSATPEGITNGTAIDAYFTPLAVPETILTVNDRLAIRVFVNASSKTITLHTQNGHLCEVITTFTAGLTALNGLQAQVQNFATGTTGTDFAIVSSGSTHTFNLPSASGTARGVVTTGDQTFAGTKTFSTIRFGASSSLFEYSGTPIFTSGTGATLNIGGGPGAIQNNLAVPNGTFNIGLQTASTIASFDASKNVVSLTTANGYPTLTELKSLVGVSTTAIQTQLNGKQATLVSGTNIRTVNGSTLLGSTNLSVGTVTSVTGTAPVVSSGGATPAISMAAATASVDGYLTAANFTTFNNKQDKSLSAYTIMANNTASTADATAQNFRSVAQQSYTNTITWTGTAPTSGTNSYSWIRIGNMVTVRLNLVYSVAGSGITAASCPLPSDCPTPLVPSGLGSAGHVLYYGSGNLQAIGTVPATPVAVVACLRLNLGGGGYDLYIQRSSGGHSVGYITVTYFTS